MRATDGTCKAVRFARNYYEMDMVGHQEMWEKTYSKPFPCFLRSCRYSFLSSSWKKTSIDWTPRCTTWWGLARDGHSFHSCHRLKATSIFRCQQKRCRVPGYFGYLILRKTLRGWWFKTKVRQSFNVGPLFGHICQQLPRKKSWLPASSVKKRNHPYTINIPVNKGVHRCLR